MKKLKNSRGETLIETLAALLIAVLAFGALTTAVLTAGKINARVRDTDVSFRYSGSESREGQALLSGILGTERGGVTVYENNGYLYYTAEEAAP